MKEKMSGYVWPATASVLFLLLWEAAVRLFRLPVFILPPPSLILAALWEDKSLLLGIHLLVTLEEILLGLGLSIVLGAGLAVWMNFSKRVEQVVYPFIVASQTIPIIALSPVVILWFGYTIWSKVLITVLIAFFPIAVNTFDGLKGTNQDWVRLLRVMGAGRGQIFFKAEIPSALPFFFSGLKVAAALSVIGATIGEWLGASAGLGYFGRRMSSTMQADALFASVLVLCLLGIALFLLMKGLERRMIPWHFAQKEDERRKIF